MPDAPSDWVPDTGGGAAVADQHEWVPDVDPRPPREETTIRASTTGENLMYDAAKAGDVAAKLLEPGMSAPSAHVAGVKTEWSDIPQQVGEWVAEQATSPVNLLLGGAGMAARGGSAITKGILKGAGALFGAQGAVTLAKEVGVPLPGAGPGQLAETAMNPDKTGADVAIEAGRTAAALGMTLAGAHGATMEAPRTAAEDFARPELKSIGRDEAQPVTEAPDATPSPVVDEWEPDTSKPTTAVTDFSGEEANLANLPDWAKEQTAPAEPETPEPSSTDEETHGIAQRVNEARAAGGNIAPVEPGEGISAEASVQHGRDLLEAGHDPQQAIDNFTQNGTISADGIALARAEGERRAKAASAAYDQFGAESPEYQVEAQADSDWAQAVKPMQTEWHKIGQAQQGETEIDTGNFHGLRRAYQDATGRDFTPEQARQAKEVAGKVKEASDAAEAATQNVLKEVAKEVPTSKPSASLAKFLSEQADAARERIRQRVTGERTSATIGADVLADYAIIGADYLAKGVTATVDWGKKMVDEFGEEIRPHLDSILEAAKAKLAEAEDEQVAGDLRDRKERLEKRIAQLNEKIETGDLSGPEKKLARPSVKEIETLEQERDRLSNELAGMRDTAAKVKELEEAVAEKENKIKEGDLSTKGISASRPAVAEIEKLKQRRDVLNRQMADLRKARVQEGAEGRRVQAEVERLTKSIAEKQAKLDAGDLSANGATVNRPSVEAVEKLKQERDALNKKLADARKEAAKVTPEEITKRKLDAINKSIVEKRAALKSGNLQPEARTANRPLLPEMEKTRQELEAVNKEIADARRAAKTAAKSPEPGSVADVWARAKKYIDAGESDFDDLRHKIAVDTGLSVEEVTQKFAAPKSTARMTDEMYAKLAARRAQISNAKGWLKNQATPGWLRFARAVPQAFFDAFTAGHGTVGMVTHAGINAFDPKPAAQAAYWDAFFKQFKLLGWHDGGAYHERMMQDLVRDPNYIAARRAGLANDPLLAMDDYQRNWLGSFLGKLGLTGNRGFDALKLFRQAKFNQIWDGLPESLQTPDSAKLVADEVNHATGVVKMRFREWSNWAFFAPKLEGSRWAWMIGDPAKAATVLTNWDRSTPAQQAFAIREVKQKAALAGTYISLLAINQGLLTATGSQQAVNFTDPKKSDFLAFKAGGYKIGVISPMLGTVRLLANLIHASIGQREGFEKGKSRAELSAKLSEDYVRGKLSPFAGVANDVRLQSDFQDRPLPFSSDKVPTSLRRQGIGKYTVPEYALEHFTPIPVSEAIKEVWRKQGMDESTANHWLSALGTAVVGGSTGARLTKDTSIKP